MNTAISTSVRVGSRLWTDGGIANLYLIDCDRADPVDVTMPDNSPLRIPVAALSHCRSYLQVELHDLFDYDRSRLSTILQKVVTMVEQGELPERLIRVFPVEQAADAFGLMLRSEHLGKLVLAFPTPRTEP